MMNEDEHVVTSKLPIDLIETETTLRTFAIDGADKTVQDIVSKLCFIAKFKKNKKVNVRTLSLVADCPWENLKRTRPIAVSKESRNVTLDFIRATTDSALAMAARCIMSKKDFHQQIGKMILQALKESKVGIGELKENPTYKTDEMFMSRIETLERILDAKINELEKRMISSLGEKSTF